MTPQLHGIRSGRTGIPGCPRRTGPGGHEGGEASVLGENDGVGDTGMRLEHRFDLARLHPVAPDLHLVVQPSEELQGAVL
ncbi:hypothetical protein SBADM41S_06168 [Streptomyces badius]